MIQNTCFTFHENIVSISSGTQLQVIIIANV